MSRYVVVMQWDGQTLADAMRDEDDAKSYRDARGYVAEIIAFHGTESGVKTRLVAPDVWRIDDVNGASATVMIMPYVGTEE